MLKELQDAIIERLTDPVLASVKVMAWPRDPKQEIGRVRADGLLLVRYLRDTGKSPDTNNEGPLIQPGIAYFELRLLLKNLRSEQDALPLMEEIRDLLSGYVPVLNANNYSLRRQGFYLSDRAFVDFYESTVWDFSMLFQIGLIYRKHPYR